MICTFIIRPTTVAIVGNKVSSLLHLLNTTTEARTGLKVGNYAGSFVVVIHTFRISISEQGEFEWPRKLFRGL